MPTLETAVARIEDALRILAECIDEGTDDSHTPHVRHAQDVLVHALDRLRYITRPTSWDSTSTDDRPPEPAP